MPTRHWLFKSEPSVFSFAHLCAKPGRRAAWDGVRNYQARNLLRDEVKVGDGVLFYHSSCEPPGVVGLARVVAAASADPTQFEPASNGYDAMATRAAPRWVQVEIGAERPLARVVTLEELRRTRGLEEMGVLRRGNRLSIQPVTTDEWALIVALGA